MSAACRLLRELNPRLLVLSVGLALAGCAGTKVESVASVAPTSAVTNPRTIAIIVSNESPPPKKAKRRERQAADVRLASTALSKYLAESLTSHALVIVSAGRTADLTLRCRIVELRSGSKAARVFVGYGVGKTTLRVRVTLEDPKSPVGLSLLGFETKATTGSMPGGGSTPYALVGEGMKMLKKDGLGIEIEQTIKAIDKQIATYFSAQNWVYVPVSRSNAS
jgi:hypothetical protein